MNYLIGDGSHTTNSPAAVDRLPLEQLAQVLQHVPLKERLSSCALVHSSWRAAAAEATTKITCCFNSNSLSAWLWSHCSRVHVTTIFIKDPDQPLNLSPLRLPVIHLQYLQKLTLRNSPWESATVAGSGQQPLQSSRTQQGALHGLANLTALTSLWLIGASVRLAGLEALTGLKDLSLTGSGCSTNALNKTAASNLDTDEALLAAALPKLHHLTSLHLRGNIGSSTTLAQLHKVQRLEQLDLTDTAITSPPTMPQSLTQLYIECSDEAETVFMSSSAQHFSQLTGVQTLVVRSAQQLDVTLLEGMASLRQVDLDAFRFAAASPEAQPLLVFSRLTALESLKLSCWNGLQVTPAEAAALTTSSHLTKLDLCECGLGYSLQEAHYEAMLPASRPLQQLRQLGANTTLLSSTVDLGLAGLTHLGLVVKGLHDGLQLAAGLSALTVLEELTSLSLIAADAIQLPAVVWSSLAGLTWLTNLYIECAAPSGQPLSRLVVPHQLPAGSVWTVCTFRSMAQATSNQDSTRDLAFICRPPQTAPLMCGCSCHRKC